MSSQSIEKPHQTLGPVARLAIFAALSALALAAAHLWQMAGWSTALFRPACAFTLAALLISHRRYWPVILLIASALGAAHALLTAVTGIALLTPSLADPLTAVLIAMLVHKLDRDAFDLTRLRSVVISSSILVAVPALLALVVSIAVAPGSGDTRALPPLAFELWSSTSLSVLLAVPFALAWLRPAPLIAEKPVGRIEWSFALLLPATTVHLIAVAVPAYKIALAALSGLLILLLWGAMRTQPRLMASALLVTGALGAWHAASLSMQHAGGWAELTLPVALICAAIVVLAISAALLSNAIEHYLNRARLRIVSSVSRQLSTAHAEAMERSIEETLYEVAGFLAASSVALYSRAADSALFRRSPGRSSAADALPDAFLARQLCATKSPGGLSIACEAAPNKFDAQDPSPNLAVKLLHADRSEMLLAASWTNAGNGANRNACALFGLLLPVYRMATTIHSKSGASLQSELLAAPIDADGETQLHVPARDETRARDKKQQQQELEKQLNQAQRMEAIGQLTQGVAHDFNNILGSILGYASLARMHQPSREDTKLQDYLSEIEVAGKRATRLIQQMLTFSRRGRSNPAPVNANDVLTRVLNILPSLLPAGVEPRLNVSQNLPQLVTDGAQFEQAIISLAVNARDAITGNGTITLGSRRFRRPAAVCNSCQKTITGEAVEIYVADSGSGIVPEVMDRLFEPFFTTKEVGRGTGLGLSGVHGFVHNHDGHILISSEVGAGSEFCMVLPVKQQQAPVLVRPAAPPKAAASHDQHILFVDDQESLATLMKQVLETRNFTVSAFTDSSAAWRKFEAEPANFDAVVTDQTMPGLDGLELARRVSALRPGLPVVLCTGVAVAVTDAELAAAGICRVFRKPLRVMDFARDLQALLVERKN